MLQYYNIYNIYIYHRKYIIYYRQTDTYYKVKLYIIHLFLTEEE